MSDNPHLPEVQSWALGLEMSWSASQGYAGGSHGGGGLWEGGTIQGESALGVLSSFGSKTFFHQQNGGQNSHQQSLATHCI